MPRTTVVATVLALALALALVAGCGSDGDGGSGVTLPSSLPERSTTTTGSAPDVTESTRPPISRPATTEAPVTTEPGTIVPPPTDTPTTEAPPTVPATTEATTTTTAEDTTTVPGAEEDGDDGSETVWWPWALIAALLVVLIGLLLVRRSRGRAAAAEARIEAALGRAADVATHLAVVVPANAQPMAAQETSELASLAVELDTVGSASSDPARTAALGRVAAQARTLHQVADGVALSPGPPSEEASGQLREQAALLHTITTEARAELQPGGSAAR